MELLHDYVNNVACKGGENLMNDGLLTKLHFFCYMRITYELLLHFSILKGVTFSFMA